MGGILKEAKIVRQSRAANSTIVGNGTGRGGPLGPKRRTNTRSLKRQRLRFADEDAANLEGPDVTVELGLLYTVDEAVSRALAVK